MSDIIIVSIVVSVVSLVGLAFGIIKCVLLSKEYNLKTANAVHSSLQNSEQPAISEPNYAPYAFLTLLCGILFITYFFATISYFVPQYISVAFTCIALLVGDVALIDMLLRLRKMLINTSKTRVCKIFATLLTVVLILCALSATVMCAGSILGLV